MALIVSKKADTPAVAEAWVDFDEETKVLLRGIDDREYQIGLERARRLLAKGDAAQSLADLSATGGDETELGIQAQLIGKYIVRGWKGIKDEDGKLVPYSPEACVGALKAKENLGFFAWVLAQAARISADQAKEQAETVGKSSSATDGNSNTSD